MSNVSNLSNLPDLSNYSDSSTFSVTSYLGKIQPFAGAEPSAIAKKAFQTPVYLTKLGLVGDEQAEKRFHGGPDRALCHYPREHYTYWQTTYPALADYFVAPGFGENISTLGMTESNTFIGDIYRWGNAIIQVTQPRSPCYKLNFHLKIDDLSLQMQQTGFCGWLYRVISEGVVSPDAPLERLSRNSNLSVKRAIDIAFNEPFDEANTRLVLQSAGLSASWCRTMQTRLLTREIESFEGRLFNNPHAK